MALGKQAKSFSDKQTDVVLGFLQTKRNSPRDCCIFLLSRFAGLRAKEIACLRWEMVLNSDNSVANTINLPNSASKGNSGRVVPINKKLREKIEVHLQHEMKRPGWSHSDHVIRTERSSKTSPQVIVNMFSGWYSDLGLTGFSSHSGRRTFITNAAKKISLVGGSIRDVQILAGHSNLQTTQRYIDYDTESHRRIVEIV